MSKQQTAHTQKKEQKILLFENIIFYPEQMEKASEWSVRLLQEKQELKQQRMHSYFLMKETARVVQ